MLPRRAPPGAQNPTPAENVGVDDFGRFNDTHGLPVGAEISVSQILQIHIRNWTYNDRGFGNPVRYLIIQAGKQPDPEKIRVYDDNYGQPGEEIPEEP